MTDDHPSGVFGGLPHTRPHRRSPKRSIPGPAGPKTGGQTDGETAPKPRQTKPRRAPSAQGPRRAAVPPTTRAPEPAEKPGAVGTAVQAAAELAEIGLMASARALRGAVSRLPRP